MKRILPVLVPAVLLIVALVLTASAFLLPAGVTAAPQKEPSKKVVTVDYVIGLLDAGIDQKEIIDRIERGQLGFRIAPGDLDRLRDAVGHGPLGPAEPAGEAGGHEPR